MAILPLPTLSWITYIVLFCNIYSAYRGIDITAEIWLTVRLANQSDHHMDTPPFCPSNLSISRRPVKTWCYDRCVVKPIKIRCAKFILHFLPSNRSNTELGINFAEKQIILHNLYFSVTVDKRGLKVTTVTVLVGSVAFWFRRNKIWHILLSYDLFFTIIVYFIILFYIRSSVCTRNKEISF